MRTPGLSREGDGRAAMALDQQRSDRNGREYSNLTTKRCKETRKQASNNKKRDETLKHKEVAQKPQNGKRKEEERNPLVAGSLLRLQHTSKGRKKEPKKSENNEKEACFVTVLLGALVSLAGLSVGCMDRVRGVLLRGGVCVFSYYFVALCHNVGVCVPREMTASVLRPPMFCFFASLSASAPTCRCVFVLLVMCVCMRPPPP